MTMWSPIDILGRIRNGLVEQDQLLRDQHAVRGIDSLHETGLHPFVAQAFTTESLLVVREAYYPSARLELPRGSQRDRCDLVLLPEGKKSLYDPVDAHKARKSADGTLFEAVASLPAIGAYECDPTEAYWIEIKVIAQNKYVDGVPGPNSKYAHELLSGPSADVVKLASESQIRYAGVLVVIFTEQEEAGIHDLSITMREMIDRDLPVGMPEYETFPIVDLGGNARCTLGLIPVRL